jgi:hypothetical protein
MNTAGGSTAIRARSTASRFWQLGLVIAVVLLGASGCRNACQRLGDRICQCRNESQFDQQTCSRQFIDANTIDISEVELERCGQLLDTCQCSDLFDNRRHECGLSNSYAAFSSAQRAGDWSVTWDTPVSPQVIVIEDK